jgi:hypothetical protein
MTALAFQTALLLALGQLFTGLLGYAADRAGWAWTALPLPLLLAWFIYRTGGVLRTEMEKAQRRKILLVPERFALFVATLWQLPALLTLPLWAPPWASQVWQGWLLPLTGTAGLLWPGARSLASWLWLAFPLQMALFYGATRPPRRRVPQVERPALKAASGDWAPARRYRDVVKKDEEPEA